MLFSVVFILTNMQIMKESRILTQNLIPPKLGEKHAPNSNKSNIRSLKAIMNQGRIPLAQYINDKTVKNSSPYGQNLTYFDKLKAMFNKGEAKTNRDIKPETAMEIEEQMEIEEREDKLQKYLYKYQDPTLAARNKNSMEYNEYIHKERSKSMNGKSRPKAEAVKKAESFLNRTKRQTEIGDIVSNINNINRTTHTQIDSIDNNTLKSPIHIAFPKGKPVKKQTVNYSKFTSLYDSGEGSVGIIELDQILGCGANATVRIGKEKKTGTLYAVKIYEKYKLIEPSKKKRVFREMQILTKINHPNVIRVINSFEDKRQIHILFEYVQNAQTLQDYMRRHLFDISAKTKQTIAIKTAEAISFIHNSGISHRDIKTDNIIVNEDGVVKLIDFGFATTVARGQTHCGTPNYMAPQLFEKKNVYNPFKVDIWALGILLFYLYEGTYPFKGYCEKDLIKNIVSGIIIFKKSDKNIRELISSMLSLQPMERPDTHILLSKLKY